MNPLKSHCLNGALAFLFACSAIFAQSSDAETEARLKKLYSRAPEADTNKDGALSVEEARAYFKSRIQVSAGKKVPADAASAPARTHADVVYGPHERNKLDLWLAKSTQPTPLVICIHGGGFRGGDKSKFHRDALIPALLKSGISVAALNYRLTEGGKHPYPASMHDCAHAVQFLRMNAGKYHLDKTRFAATGGSAGGCISLWLAFHEDLADPKAEDPLLRESTRLTCAAPNAVPTSLETATLLKWFETPSLVEHPATRPFFSRSDSGEFDANAPEALAKAKDASPVTHLTRDDPPVYLTYSGDDSKVDATTEPGKWVHHPRTGIKLKEQMDTLKIPCYLQYRGVKHSGDYADATDFLIRTLAAPSGR